MSQLPDRMLALAKRFAGFSPAERSALQAKMIAQGLSLDILPIPPREAGISELPASYAQQRLWLVWQLDPQSSAYNQPAQLRLRGQLNSTALEQAIGQLIERHEVLRTSFRWHEQQVLQVIHPQRRFALTRLDLSAAGEGAEALLAEQMTALAEQPFDLERDLLLRATLIKLDAEQHVLLFCSHHIVCDAWSLPILVGEVSEGYRQALHGQRAALPPLAVHYADYAHWQRLWLEAGEGERQLAYWRERLGSEHVQLALPLDRPRTASRSNRGARHEIEFDAALGARLRAMSAATGSTLFMLLLASFQAVLHRYSGAAQVRVGTPVANRTRAEVEGLIGFFVNTQVLQADITPQQTFAALLAQVKSRVLEAQVHQDTPFEQLVDALQPERNLDSSPLFQVLYNHLVDAADAGRLELPGLTVEVQGSGHEAVRFDLTLSTREADGRLYAALVYATDLFDASTIARLAEHWRNLLADALRDPQQAIGDLALYSPAEQQQLAQWAEGGPLQQRALDVPARISAHAQTTPEAIAVVQGARRLSYAQLDGQAEALAGRLREQGVGADVLVGIAAERSLEMVVGLLAVLKAGGAYVPLAPEYPQQRLNQMIADSALEHLLVQAPLAERFAELTGVRQQLLPDPTQALSGSGWALAPISDPQQLAYVIFTSGSTGRAKGVTVSHGALANYVAAIGERLPITQARSMALVSTMAADLGHTVLFGALCHGQALHLIDNDMAVDGSALGAYLHNEQIDVLKIVPSHLAALLGEDNAAVIPRQCLVLGGEACPPSLLQRIQQLAPACCVVNHYGPTETTVGAITQSLDGDWAHATRLPLGRPLANLRAYVLDSDAGALPVNCAGELYLGGAGVARGYHLRPGMTAERFVPNPFSADGARLYRTGDQARYRADGLLEFIGRVDHQVKIRGYRVEPGEVQACLQSHPQVRECAVVAQDGPTGKQLVAYLVAAEADLPGIRQWLGEQLAAHQVPSHLLLLPTLPLTANGKLDHKALPQPDVSSQADYRAAANDVQGQLVEIWQALLGVERVGISDNFFELGGDSIIAIQMVGRARQAGIHIASKDVFRCQTILELAAVASCIQVLQIDQGPVRGEMPLTPIQQVFFASDIPQLQHWNQSVLLTPRSPLQVALLAQALSTLQQHHDALRLRYQQVAGQWQASHVDSIEACLWHEAVADEAAVRDLGQRAQASLDLSNGPVLRAVLMDLADGSQRLLLVIHHLVVDGVSWRVLLEDLQQLYRDLQQGTLARLPAKTSAFQSWALRLREHARGPLTEAELAYWQRLRDADASLPLDRPHGANLACHGRAINTRLPREATTRLLQDAARAYRTQINDLLLLALAEMVCRWTGRPEVLVQLEGHGREELFPEIDLSRTVGWFTSLYPVRLAPADDIASSIKAIKEQLRQVPGNGLGFGVLRHLGDDACRAALAAVPKPAITFNYLGQFDQSFDEHSLFAPAAENAGDERDSRAPLGNWLTLNSQVYGGELALSWSFSSEVFDDATVQRLADDYQATLLALIEHCCQLASGGVTPSDFPLAALEQTQLDALPVAPRAIADLYPLAPMQQGMLFHTLYQQASDDYVNQLQVPVQGLDAERFGKAWADAITAHDILRTSFHWQGELSEPVQIVHRQVELPLQVLDGQGVDLEALAAAERQACSRFDQAPLLRLLLLELGGDKQYLIYTNHHILMDGWSSSQLMSEVMQRYHGLQPARQPGRYRDYIGWLQRQDGAACESFWRQRLTALDEPTRLAGSLARGTGASGHGEFHHDWDEANSQHLQAFARQQKVTVNTLVQAAWLLLLQRYTGQASVAFGATLAGRPAELPGIEQQVGLFINTLPVIATPQAGQRVGDWLHSVQAENLALREFEHTPLNDIQRWAGTGGEALFDSLLVFDNYPVAEALGQQAESSVRFGDVASRERTNYPLAVAVAAERRLSISYGYDRAAFTHAAIERLNGHLLQLLAAFMVDAERPLASIELLTEAERAALCHDWPRFAEPPVHLGIGAMAGAWPERQALIFNGQRFSYGELDRRANRLAHELIARGVGQELRVGVALPRSDGLLVALLAVLKAGGAYVPLDLSYPRERLAYLMEDSAISLLLTEAPQRAQLPIPPGLAVLELNSLDLSQHASSAPAVEVAPESLAYIIYTSGSTGRPKGVAVAHGPLAMHCRSTGEAYRMTPADCELHFLSFAFDGAHERWLTGLLHGSSILLRDDSLWTPEQTCEALREYGATMAGFPPVYLHQLAEHVQRVGNPPPMRLYSFGGDAMPQASFELVQQVLKPKMMINGYGPTETVVTPMVWRTDLHDVCSAAYAPIGSCVGERSAYVLDADLNLLPVGVAGELYIGGTGLARGYLNRPGQSAERFVPDPYGEAGARLYRTGDVVRQDEAGVFEYLGRIDSQVKIRGFRIELGEIEARLMGFAAISEAVVLAQETAQGRRLVAYLVAAAGQRQAHTDAALLEPIKAELKAALPDYMLPAHWLLLEQLPLTPNGKLDRKALPLPTVDHAARSYVAPRNDVESTLAALWQEVLKVEQVGVTDNFFELGGDSIISLQLVGRARQASIRFTPKDLFEQQTIQALAAVAEVGEGEQIDQGPVTGAQVLLPVQQWFFEEPIPSRYHWNQSVLLKGREPLQAAALEQALQALVAHHDALRLAFVEQADGWQAHYRDVDVAQSLLWQVEVADTAELQARCEAAQRSFDLAAGPLLRAVLATLADGSQRLLLVVHHLVVDGVSWRVLFEDLQQAYQQALQNQPVQLPAKSSAYQRWAERLQTHAQRAAAPAELDYWCSQLSGAVTGLPGVAANAIASGLDATSVHAQLDTEQTRRLLQAAPAAYRTQVNDLLLTALAQVVGQWTGAGSTLIQLEGHGREALFDDIDLSRTVGWFTSVFPLKLTPAHDPASSIKAIKEQLRAIPDKGLGYGVLRYLGSADTRRQLAALPVPRITFNYLGQFDGSFSQDDALFSPASEAHGSDSSAEAPLGNWLSISGKVYDGRLRLDWSFSQAMFDPAPMQALADAYVQALAELIEHCCDERHAGVTPSDFPLAGLAQPQLDALGVAPAAIEDIYPLAPMQQYLLQHELHDAVAGDFVNQMCMDLDGVDPERLRQAWQAAMDHHPILRTRFAWAAPLTAPVQVVHRQVRLPLRQVDGCELSTAQLEQLANDERLRGFELDAEPLLRLVLIHRGGARYRLLCTNHHILLDGWSGFQLFNDVLAAYTGQALVRSGGGYRDYIAWLQSRDRSADQHFWQGQLASLHTPTLLQRCAIGRTAAAGGGHGELGYRFDALQTEQVASFARRQKITVNTLMQAAWLLLLHHHTGESTVACGVTLSGRPPHLRDIERQLGLYINDVPLVAEIDRLQGLGDWLQDLQARNLQVREHGYNAPAEIEGWAGLGGALADTVIVFENYPVSAAQASGDSRGLRLQAMNSVEQANTPLTLYVELKGQLQLRFDYRLDAFAEDAVGLLNEQLLQVLWQLVDGRVDRNLGEVLGKRPLAA
ncbi:amino acid adenylation domain-containing protein/non-ribosomal peptide synthase protein (TIGR01720 family) [Pseudomonas sp. BIGb0278]|uniref:non-ribosomal peptide synthetase n=1 Tax=Pseudomonas sp. BIGb0278 TaxID=2940607 RepID=UPI00216A4FAE|nr:non-ribosomal peptide synthetase [Pseudomonas sp. BIGb0278]MCS4283364.1 amino acid adenylation domain-containing protein/non-ribosomal peptide synthase protein (TIGR01720 family) [Pseudomonas sp. BIGb0278]